MPRARVRTALLQPSAEVRDQWTRRALRVVPEFVRGRLAHRTRQPVTRTVLWRAPDNHARSAKVVRQQKAHGRVGVGQERAVDRRPGLGANAWHAVVMVVPVPRNKSVDRKGDRVKRNDWRSTHCQAKGKTGSGVAGLEMFAQRRLPVTSPETLSAWSAVALSTPCRAPNRSGTEDNPAASR